jgi:DNA-binding PadR family transcriptional regulator
MSVPNALLGLLAPGPRHGYDIKRGYDHWFAHAKPLRFGQIYATLQRLERDGLITLDEVEPGQGPERKTYAITPAGEAHTEAWLTQPEPPEPFLQPVLYMKLALVLTSDRSGEAMLDAQAAEHRRRMREIMELRRSQAATDQVLADHALFHLEADLKWMEVVRDRLGALRAELTTA